jgi:hypothetical protein
MPTASSDHSYAELPRALIYSTAITCGVLSALMLQIYLGRNGFDLVSLGNDVVSAKAPQLRAAGPWWAIAGLAFIVGGAAGAALSRFPPPWRRFRLLRWAAGAAIVVLMADIGHSGGTPAGVAPAAQLAASLAALAVAALMAMLGAYITTARR